MAAHISSPYEPYPSSAHLEQATTSHRQGNFTIATRKLPISKAGPIDSMEKSLGIPIPEMIFGDNMVSITHEPSGWKIEFNAYEALDRVDKTDKNMLQVAYARSWSASREQTSAGIKEVVKPYDWSYTTDYRGTVTDGNNDNNNNIHPSQNSATTISSQETQSQTPAQLQPQPQQGPGDASTQTPQELPRSLTTQNAPPIPIELLKRRDPILFFDDLVLYESELDDNGISIFSVKLRVHASRMLLLARHFMRLDNVLVRVRDTRVYVDFDDEVVVREYTEQEGEFGEVKRLLMGYGGLRPDDLTVALRDANRIAELLPKKDGIREWVVLKGA